MLNAAVLADHAFDPYPFIFLNLLLSMLAAIQAPIIMMSQNRQAEKDRLAAALDYEVNVKAETAIAELHDKVDRLQAQIARLLAQKSGPLTPLDRRAEPRQRAAQVVVARCRSCRRRAAPTTAGSGAGRAAPSSPRRASGAWRIWMRPTARQPKKRFTFSMMTPERCWISSATGPSTRSTSVAGSGSSSCTRRGQIIRIGSA